MQTYHVTIGQKECNLRAKSIVTLRKRLIDDLKSGYFMTATVRTTDGKTCLLEVQHGGFAMWYANIRYRPDGSFTCEKVHEVNSDGSLGRRR